MSLSRLRLPLGAYWLVILANRLAPLGLKVSETCTAPDMGSRSISARLSVSPVIAARVLTKQGVKTSRPSLSFSGWSMNTCWAGASKAATRRA